MVLTATLVAPRVTPSAALKRRNRRLFAGSKTTGPVPVTEIVNVAGTLGAAVNVTPPATGVTGLMLWPLAGSVWYSVKPTAKPCRRHPPSP